MRFDTPVYFRTLTQGELDPETGNYLDSDSVEVERYASVTTSGAKTLQLVYGQLKQGSKVIRLQNHYNDKFDNIRIGDKEYGVDFSRRLPVRHVFVVSELQGGAL
jgi:hypothetical protein